jgi:hypothetical protein
VKCIKQPVLNVRRNVKFHSNHLETDLFIAKNVMLRKGHREDREKHTQKNFLKIFYGYLTEMASTSPEKV